ncbi:MAG: hypothetical protein Q4C87_03690 [Actinomycetaceae bacterium]|nr:hypothetical protein [Actinomycetaceae bacterium]
MRNISFSSEYSDGSVIMLAEFLPAINLEGLHWVAHCRWISYWGQWPRDLLDYIHERENDVHPIEVEMIRRIASYPAQCIEVRFAGYRDKSDRWPELLFGIEDNYQWEIHYRDPARIDFAALEKFSPFVEENPWLAGKDGSISPRLEYPFLRLENRESASGY